MITSRAYEKRRLQLMAELAAGKNILDVGYAAKPNPHLHSFYCVGYDLNKPTNEDIKYNEQIEGDVASINEILRGRKFDTIICGELIEHLENPYRLLRDLQKLLNANGHLILSTPNPLGFPVFIVEILRNKNYFFERDHRYYFLPRWVERLLDNTGYKLVRLKSVGIWLPWFVIPISPVVLSYQIIYVAQQKD